MDIWIWTWEAGRSDVGRQGSVAQDTLFDKRWLSLIEPFHAITKVLSVLRVKAAFMMGIDKGIEEAQNHDSIFKASPEYSGDQVV